jgi:hypothetical protein
MKINKLTYITIIAGILTIAIFSAAVPNNSIVNEITSVDVTDSTPSVIMYNSIMKYSEEYSIPKEYAFALAYQETRYQGPAHAEYKHAVKSKAGALGPMQIMYKTAQMFIDEDEKLTKKLLKTDIDLNVKLSMKILRHLKDKHGDWGKAFGAYNTGRPILNRYAKNILNLKYNWISFS